ncbi:DeoR/GlpR transcriptional regulator [Photobacterium carnosum]|uniref:DeoR/GlpR family DNA-binding transcription regulator n=1 Tax=Photobacterium carnosum TaxID=2023717 RepID=UPI001E2962DB|nr:DeoR/GlpR family DNA-binding transcription regulator [Photobacterium carnosum]MCD9558288.1 DeoR/GlpR transcriptional regulator [Photobacterium carnosum]
MLVTNRVNYILNTINRIGKVSVINLSKELNVSLETIRRDLKQLDEQGELIRIHGGAKNKKYKDEGTSFNNRAHLNINDKQTLVNQVIENIYEGCVIGLDASSSSWLVAQAMPDFRCTVVTNSLNNINVLSEKRNITTIALGGYFSEKYKAFYGLITRNNLIEMTLDLCVISCVGFDKESGVWDSNEYNLDVKRTLIKVSNKSILIADKSKHRKKSLLKICNIDEIDILISNAEI